MTMKDITRLPKWAQAEISRLQANNASLKQELAIAKQLPDTDDDCIIIDPYDEPVFLHKRRHVTFRVNGRKIDVDIRNGYDGVPTLKVSANSGGSVSITPVAANVVYVSTDR